MYHILFCICPKNKINLTIIILAFFCPKNMYHMLALSKAKILQPGGAYVQNCHNTSNCKLKQKNDQHHVHIHETLPQMHMTYAAFGVGVLKWHAFENQDILNLHLKCKCKKGKEITSGKKQKGKLARMALLAQLPLLCAGECTRAEPTAASRRHCHCAVGLPCQRQRKTQKKGGAERGIEPGSHR